MARDMNIVFRVRVDNQLSVIGETVKESSNSHSSDITSISIEHSGIANPKLQCAIFGRGQSFKIQIFF